jgi:hypothetical protein
MNGIFINLTENDIKIESEHKEDIFILGNPDLVTPTRKEANRDNIINAVYLNSDRAEKDINITITKISEHIKYPFTQDQIDKINSMSKGRTRLLIMPRKDAICWAHGMFEAPFRNYRLFSLINNNTLLEHTVPKSYLDIVVDTAKYTMITGKQLYNDNF